MRKLKYRELQREECELYGREDRLSMLSEVDVSSLTATEHSLMCKDGAVGGEAP